TGHRNTTLRVDSERISNINTFIIRAVFFGVLFVGVGDMIISFLRVEGFLEPLVGKELTRSLGVSQFRGTYVHVPLLVLGFVAASLTRTLGFIWLSLLIVAAELLIVITRFIFSYEQAFMGDLVRFWYAALFLFASAYTLHEEGHVRVDVFYSTFRTKTRGVVNALGSLLLGMALCWTILIVGLGSKSSVIYAPIRSFETSQSGYGMYVKYLMAGFLGVFAITMLIQFTSYLLGAVADILDEPGHVDHEAPTT
ncbi:MAG: TRAP transporter small permease subunit, partial [Methylococcales bacterium]|nr:TRAP transporter small permease subunit [Methylococcales bacterium]